MRNQKERVWMVGLANPSPNPGTGVDPRTEGETRQADRRIISSRWSAARQSVRAALADLDLTLAAARTTLRTLARIEAAAGEGDWAAAAALLAQLHEDVDRAIKAGARALTGAAVNVATEADAPPLEIAGLDVRLKCEADPEDPMRLSRASLADNAAQLACLARESIARIQPGYERLELAARRLEAHDGVLALAEAPSGGADADADGARLAALAVRQGLSEASGVIADVRPDSLLALFRG